MFRPSQQTLIKFELIAFLIIFLERIIDSVYCKHLDCYFYCCESVFIRTKVIEVKPPKRPSLMSRIRTKPTPKLKQKKKSSEDGSSEESDSSDGSEDEDGGEDSPPRTKKVNIKSQAIFVKEPDDDSPSLWLYVNLQGITGNSLKMLQKACYLVINSALDKILVIDAKEPKYRIVDGKPKNYHPRVFLPNPDRCRITDFEVFESKRENFVFFLTQKSGFYMYQIWDTDPPKALLILKFDRFNLSIKRNEVIKNFDICPKGRFLAFITTSEAHPGAGAPEFMSQALIFEISQQFKHRYDTFHLLGLLKNVKRQNGLKRAKNEISYSLNFKAQLDLGGKVLNPPQSLKFSGYLYENLIFGVLVRDGNGLILSFNYDLVKNVVEELRGLRRRHAEEQFSRFVTFFEQEKVHDDVGGEEAGNGRKVVGSDEDEKKELTVKLYFTGSSGSLWVFSHKLDKD